MLIKLNDLIAVHGDRLELQRCVVGSFKNILVAHVEEISGTIDELMDILLLNSLIFTLYLIRLKID